MELQDFLLRVKDLDEPHLVLKLHNLIRENYHYKILSPANQDLIMQLVMKHRDKWRHGIGISQQTIDEEYHHLYENRSELDLQENDLKIMKEVLMFFKR
jgi:CYTH domain-containing protein